MAGSRERRALTGRRVRAPQADPGAAAGAVLSAKVAKMVEVLRAARDEGAPDGGREIKSVVFSQWTGALARRSPHAVASSGARPPACARMTVHTGLSCRRHAEALPIMPVPFLHLCPTGALWYRKHASRWHMDS